MLSKGLCGFVITETGSMLSNMWTLCLQGAEGGNRRVVPGGAVQAL